MRLFIAAPLPRELGERASALLPSIPGLVRVRPELMHITLAFIGDTADGQLPAAVAATAAAALGRAPFELCFDRAGRFPRSGRPRIIWLGSGTGTLELTELAGAVGRCLRERGVRFDDRAFAPHVTLARTREGLDPDDARAIAAAIDGLQVPVWCTLVDRIALIQSVLFREGPRYTERSSAPLA